MTHAGDGRAVAYGGRGHLELILRAGVCNLGTRLNSVARQNSTIRTCINRLFSSLVYVFFRLYDNWPGVVGSFLPFYSSSWPGLRDHWRLWLGYDESVLNTADESPFALYWVASVDGLGSL